MEEPRASPSRSSARRRRARDGAREAIPLVLLACACGAAARVGPSSAAGSPRAPATSSAAFADFAGGVGGAGHFDSIETRAALVAPGMREIARRESAGERIELVRADRQDACVRVAFESTGPVVGKLVDGVGAVLAASQEATTRGVLGEHGPVCVRRGESVNAIAEGAPTRVRWVAWVAP
jgi:hypothetical protein